MQYITAFAALVMTIVLLTTARRRADQSLLYASAMLLGSLLSDIENIYLPLDGLITSITGRSNVLGLLGTMLMVLGVHFLARAVFRASWSPQQRVSEIVFRASLAVTIFGMIASFLMVDSDHSTAAFMRDFGTQPAAAAYSMIQFGYIGCVMILLGHFTFNAAKSQILKMQKIGVLFISAACAFAAIMVVCVFGMDIAHLGGSTGILSIFAAIYAPVSSVTMILLCVGLCAFPLAQSMQRKRQMLLLEGLLDVRGRLAGGTKALPAPGVEENLDSQLYRLFIEIEDILSGGPPSVRSLLSDVDLQRMLATEKYLQTQ